MWHSPQRTPLSVTRIMPNNDSSFSIETVSPDRLRSARWHFSILNDYTVGLVGYDEWLRQTTRHRFRDGRAWFKTETDAAKWTGVLIDRPELPQTIAQRVRESLRRYVAFE